MKALHVLLIGALLATCGAAMCMGENAAGGKECARDSMQAARNALENANRLFESGDVKAAHDAIDETMNQARRSVQCSLDSHKDEKGEEIELRELIRRMKDVSRTLDSEDRSHLSKVVAGLEEQRDRLLHALFGPAAETGKKP